MASAATVWLLISISNVVVVETSLAETITNSGWSRSQQPKDRNLNASQIFANQLWPPTSLPKTKAQRMSAKVKAYELRAKSKEELSKQLEDLKREYANLRVQKVSQNNNQKVTNL